MEKAGFSTRQLFGVEVKDVEGSGAGFGVWRDGRFAHQFVVLL